jgi:hypothetical protein
MSPVRGRRRRALQERLRGRAAGAAAAASRPPLAIGLALGIVARQRRSDLADPLHGDPFAPRGSQWTVRALELYDALDARLSPRVVSRPVTRVSCPSCAGEVIFQAKTSLYAVCPSCTSLVLRKDVDVEKVGVLAALHDDGSPVRLGTTGRYRGVEFTTIGRIQLRTETSFWNEWYVAFADGGAGWLGEAQGLYCVTFPAEPPEEIPPFDRLRVGRAVTIAGERFEVTDLERASCVSGEGELPFEIESGYEAPAADLGTATARMASIDFSEDRPLVFVGEWLEFDDLALANLRALEGW